MGHAEWSCLTASKILLGLIIKFIGPNHSLVMIIDDTLERRKGRKIKAKGYYFEFFIIDIFSKFSVILLTQGRVVAEVVIFFLNCSLRPCDSVFLR